MQSMSVFASSAIVMQEPRNPDLRNDYLEVRLKLDTEVYICTSIPLGVRKRCTSTYSLGAVTSPIKYLQ